MSDVHYRPPTPQDAPAVFEMLVARDLVDYGAPDITLADLRDEWEAADFDLRADAILAVTETGTIAGYTALRRPGAMGFVSPDHERQGIGSRLVDFAQACERRVARPRHRQAAAATNARARELFESRGYAYERSYTRMVRTLATDEAAPPLPGLALRPVAIDRDAASIHAVNELSFAANPDYDAEPLRDFVQEHLRAHDHAPELSLVAFDADTLVGFLIARRWSKESVGFVDLLAVHPQAQRRGLGSGLLRTAFAGFAAAGLREAQLGVASDNPRALRLYERAGMTARFSVDTFTRELTAQPPSSEG